MTDMRRDAGGFTLIEVVVALLVVSIASAAAFEGFAVGFRASRQAGALEEAVFVAQSKLDEAAVVLPSGAAESSGVVLGRYRWKARVEAPAGGPDRSEGAGALQPYVVSVKVSWGEGEAERSLSLSALRLGVAQGRGRP